MNLKEKAKNYGFWISLVSAVIIAVQAFGVQISEAEIMGAVNAVLGVLIILGVISDADKGNGYLD